MNAFILTYCPYSFVFFRTLLLSIKIKLHRTLNILAIFSAFIINITIDWHQLFLIYQITKYYKECCIERYLRLLKLHSKYPLPHFNWRNSIEDSINYVKGKCQWNRLIRIFLFPLCHLQKQSFFSNLLLQGINFALFICTFSNFTQICSHIMKLYGL